MTIYLPDSLAAEVDSRLSDHNISAICQAALRAELDRVKARAGIDGEGFERVEVYDSQKDRDVAFQGHRIGRSYEHELEAWTTPKGSIAVYDPVEERLYTYADWEEFAADDLPEDLRAEVAGSLGQEYVEELDI